MPGESRDSRANSYDMYAAADGCQPRGAAKIGSTSGRQAPHALPGRGACHNPDGLGGPNTAMARGHRSFPVHDRGIALL
jgi:hypothetical protein